MGVEKTISTLFFAGIGLLSLLLLSIDGPLNQWVLMIGIIFLGFLGIAGALYEKNWGATLILIALGIMLLDLMYLFSLGMMSYTFGLSLITTMLAFLFALGIEFPSLGLRLPSKKEIEELEQAEKDMQRIAKVINTQTKEKKKAVRKAAKKKTSKKKKAVKKTAKAKAKKVVKRTSTKKKTTKKTAKRKAVKKATKKAKKTVKKKALKRAKK